MKSSYLRQTPGCSLGWHLIFAARHASQAVEILLRAGHDSIGDGSLAICSVCVVFMSIRQMDQFDKLIGLYTNVASIG